MGFFEKLRGTFETIFQIGKQGPNIKNNSGAIELRNFADSTFVIGRGLDPVGINDFVTKGYFDTNNAAAQGLTYVKLTLAQATVVSTGVIPDNARILDVILDITTAYDATTTIALSRTGGGAAIAATGDSDPTVVGQYQIPQTTSWGATGAGTLTATVSGTPAAGVAVIYVGYTTPTSIN